MDSTMKLYWSLIFKKYSNEELLRHLNNPIREYESEMIDGVIADIGCGQSSYLLDFATTDRKLIAIDSEQLQLDFLKKRVESDYLNKIENWVFLNKNFPQDDLPNEQYSLIIISNLLHFFTFEECLEIGKLISKISTKGTLIYVVVHSDKHYAKKSQEQKKENYFKHFFSTTELDLIFPNPLFESIYCAEIEQTDSKKVVEFTKEWINEYCKVNNITDAQTIERTKSEHLKNKKQSNIEVIFRKT